MSATQEIRDTGRPSEPLSGPAVLGGSLLMLLTGLVVVGPPLLMYGLMAQYGPGDPPSQIDAGALAALVGYGVVCGALVAACWWFVRRAALKPVRRLWAVGLVAGVVCALLPVLGANLGTRSWNHDQEVIAAACSAQEIAAVSQMAAYGNEFNAAQGGPDGRCTGWIMMPGDDGPAVMQGLWTAMASHGWTTSDTDASVRVWTRDGYTVRVSFIQSSDGTTGVGVEGLE